METKHLLQESCSIDRRSEGFGVKMIMRWPNPSLLSHSWRSQDLLLSDLHEVTPVVVSCIHALPTKLPWCVLLYIIFIFYLRLDVLLQTSETLDYMIRHKLNHLHYCKFRETILEYDV